MSSAVSQEDIAQPAESWPSEEHTQFNKGKGKERQVHTENQDLRKSSKTPDASSYPPINDNAEESRRVEENLRRWEIAERQRRKAARESSAVGVVSRRATLLWQGKKSKVPPIGGVSAHTALQSRDNIDILPLRDINASPTPSSSRSNSEDGHIADPFANPLDALSPFSDAHQPEQPEVIPVSYENETPVFVYTNPPKASHPPPPKPLSLPPPRISPPVAIMTPISQSNPTYGDSNEQDTRWWHEWLCRCGEGPDRGGDNQAGRTNPFE